MKDRNLSISINFMQLYGFILRGLNEFGTLAAMSATEDNFRDFLFAFQWS